MVTLMDDQNEAWRRLTDARLKALEAAVVPVRIRRRKDGRPLPPRAWEPGDRRPLTKWLDLRIMALELLFRLLLDANLEQAEDLDVRSLERLIADDMLVLTAWAERQVEPDLMTRTTMAVVTQASVILMEAHHWPLTLDEGDDD